jgi:hypothetical protein
MRGRFGSEWHCCSNICDDQVKLFLSLSPLCGLINNNQQKKLVPHSYWEVCVRTPVLSAVLSPIYSSHRQAPPSFLVGTVQQPHWFVYSLCRSHLESNKKSEKQKFSL